MILKRFSIKQGNKKCGIFNCGSEFKKMSEVEQYHYSFVFETLESPEIKRAKWYFTEEGMNFLNIDRFAEIVFKTIPNHDNKKIVIESVDYDSVKDKIIYEDDFQIAIR